MEVRTSSHYFPYPSTCDSGLPWFGHIPAHWDVKRLKYVANIDMGQSPSSDEYTLDGIGRPFLQGNAEFGECHPTPKYFCDTARKFVLIGDYLLSVRAPVGALNIADQEYGIGRGLCAIRPLTNFLDHRFTWYLIEVSRKQLDMISTGSTYEAVSVDQVANAISVVPPLPEQRTIAAYLDRQTVKIDALIAKKKRLLDLLAEQRVALISQAVTKGLNPDVKMKDSGAVWLGQVPEHWEVLPIKRISRVRYGLGQPPKEQTEGLPLIRATNINSGVITEKGMMYIDPQDVPPGRDAELREGEIIVVRSGAYTGDSAIVPSKYNKAIAGYDMILTIEKGNSNFFAWQMLSYSVRDIYFNFHKLRAAQPHLNAEELKETIVAIPPVKEQTEIAEYLAYQTKRLTDLAAKVESAVERLREYRSALISSAVTGKIKV